MLKRAEKQLKTTDSVWSLLEVVNLKVNINRYAPFQAESSTCIELPDFVQRKKLCQY